MLKRFKLALSGLALVTALSACGDVAFFFRFGSVETGTGLVIVLNGGSDDDDREIDGAVVVGGAIPLGMEVTLDGTLEGTPERTGHHEFTVKWRYDDGTSERLGYGIEITD